MNRAELKARRTRAKQVHDYGSYRQRFAAYYQPIAEMGKTEFEQIDREIIECIIRLQQELLIRGSNEYLSFGGKKFGTNPEDRAQLILYSRENHPEFMVASVQRNIPSSYFSNWKHLILSFTIENYYQLGATPSLLPGEQDLQSEMDLSDEDAPLPEELAMIQALGLRLIPNLAQTVYLQQHHLEFSQFILQRCLAAEIRLLQQPLPVPSEESEAEPSDHPITR